MFWSLRICQVASVYLSESFVLKSETLKVVGVHVYLARLHLTAAETIIYGMSH